MNAPKIVIRCAKGCIGKTSGKHSAVCLEAQVRKLKLRLRTNELRCIEAHGALDRSAGRLRAAENRIAGHERNRARTLEEVRLAQGRVRARVLLSDEFLKMLEYIADVSIGRRA